MDTTVDSCAYTRTALHSTRVTLVSESSSLLTDGDMNYAILKTVTEVS